MATADHNPRTCRVCGEPLPNGTPRVELRIAETLPRENGFTPSDATRTTIASAQICTGCAPEIIDNIEAMLDGKAIGGGFDETRYRRVCRLLEDAVATMAAWGAPDE